MRGQRGKATDMQVQGADVREADMHHKNRIVHDTVAWENSYAFFYGQWTGCFGTMPSERHRGALSG